MHNKYSLQVAHLAHMTPEEKKEYNKKYYQEHKDYWTEYYGREGVAKRNQALADKHAGAKAALDRLKNERQRPHTVMDGWHKVTYGGESLAEKEARIERGARAEERAMAGKKYVSAFTPPSWDPYWDRVQGGRSSTPDLNARASAIQKTRQQSARLSTSDLSQRLANMNAYTANSRSATLSSIASSAVSRGKSIVSNIASLWKLGWK